MYNQPPRDMPPSDMGAQEGSRQQYNLGEILQTIRTIGQVMESPEFQHLLMAAQQMGQPQMPAPMQDPMAGMPPQSVMQGYDDGPAY